MRLRKPCEHGRYEVHHQVQIEHGVMVEDYDCPGGEFLADDALVIPEPIVRPLGTPLTYAGVREVWDTFVVPHQEEPPSIEMRCLSAILRAVAKGYADRDALTVREGAG